MKDTIIRRLFLGFIQIHILYHAKEEPLFGLWMIKELERHGYTISAGTLYPILNNMERIGLLKVKKENVEGKIRKYYSITRKGEELLKEARNKARELFNEICN
ncbi:MAG: PadR family transcriptional regulator [bacterium]